MKEHDILLIGMGLLFSFALIIAVVAGQIYWILAALASLLLLPVWSRIFKRFERKRS